MESRVLCCLSGEEKCQSAVSDADIKTCCRSHSAFPISEFEINDHRGMKQLKGSLFSISIHVSLIIIFRFNEILICFWNVFVTRAHFDDFTVCKEKPGGVHFSPFGFEFLLTVFCIYCWRRFVSLVLNLCACLTEERCCGSCGGTAMLWFVPLHACGRQFVDPKRAGVWSCDHGLDKEQVFVYIMYIIVHAGRPPPTRVRYVYFCIYT